jgi:hypothetical protein
VEVWTFGGRYHVGIFTTKLIRATEELTFDYQWPPSDREPTICRCGTASCRGTIEVMTKKSSGGSGRKGRSFERERGCWRSREVCGFDQMVSDADRSNWLIGRRLRISWNEDEVYIGMVISQSVKSERCFVVRYEDDDSTVEDEKLYETKWEWFDESYGGGKSFKRKVIKF